MQAYTNEYLYRLGDFYFLGKRSKNSPPIDKSKVFQVIIQRKPLPANRKLPKNPNDLTINIYKDETIFYYFKHRLCYGIVIKLLSVQIVLLLILV